VLVYDVCPFCDQPLAPRCEGWFDGLPTTTSSTLCNIMESAWEVSSPETRLGNPNARVIDDLRDEAYAVCEQHRYESFILPMAMHYNWPRSVDFEDVLSRCQSTTLWEKLKTVYQNPWAAASLSPNVTPLKNSFDLSKAPFRYEESTVAG
jgi:hypothetical protein